MPPEPNGLPLLAYAGMVWRRRLLVLVSAVGLTVPAYAASALQAPVYQATGQILLVSQQIDESFNVRTSELNDRQVGIQVALLTGDDVSALAMKGGAATRVRAQSSEGSNVVTVIAQDSDAQRAATTVAAYIRAYTDNRVLQSQRAIDSAASQVDQRIARVRDGLNTPSAVERGAFELQLQSLQEQASRLQVQRGLVESGVTVVEAPYPPAAPISPKPLRDGALGLVIGIGLGISLAVLLETVRRRREPSADASQPAVDVPASSVTPSAAPAEAPTALATSAAGGLEAPTNGTSPAQQPGSARGGRIGGPGLPMEVPPRGTAGPQPRAAPTPTSRTSASSSAPPRAGGRPVIPHAGAWNPVSSSPSPRPSGATRHALREPGDLDSTSSPPLRPSASDRPGKSPADVPESES